MNTTKLSKITKTQAKKLLHTQGDINITIPFGKKTTTLSKFFTFDISNKVLFYNFLKSYKTTNISIFKNQEELNKKYTKIMFDLYSTFMLKKVFQTMDTSAETLKHSLKWISINKHSDLNTVFQLLKVECEKDGIKKGWIVNAVKQFHIQIVDEFFKTNKKGE